jgi:hypothetical protein
MKTQLVRGLLVTVKFFVAEEDLRHCDEPSEPVADTRVKTIVETSFRKGFDGAPIHPLAVEVTVE